MAITEQDVQTALKQLTDPNTRLDYVTGKSAKNIKVEGNNVAVDILLGYPAKSQVEPIRREIAAKLKTLPGVGSVTVNVAIKIVPSLIISAIFVSTRFNRKMLSTTARWTSRAVMTRWPPLPAQ